MTQLGFPADGEAFSGTDGDTEELAWELQQTRPDTHRIKWLIEDMHADVKEALAKANLGEGDLLRHPSLRPLGLQKYMHRGH